MTDSAFATLRGFSVSTDSQFMTQGDNPPPRYFGVRNPLLISR
jgi:hypothetical protein